jgi:hypothetical protein
MLKIKAKNYVEKSMLSLLPMSLNLYQPFLSFNFSNKHCFLSGEALQSPNERIPVFPQWLMDSYQLQGQPFKLLDESMATYGDMQLPCAASVFYEYIQPLELEIEQAFEKGYTGIKELDEFKLFQWAGKLIYGIIFNELQIAISQQHAQGEELNVSQSIIHKYSNLHLMLQTLNKPVILEDLKPFSLFLYQVNNPDNEFAYRDEINTLTFALRAKDFGLVICLQDNECNRKYHRNVLEKIGPATLHPIQFEELSARIFYSAYLFNRLPEYDILPAGDEIYIEAVSLRGMAAKPLFDDWIGKTFGQVLESFWKRWGFLLFEIIKNPEHPMSYLFDKEGNYIPAGSIDLPL